jgi:3-oxoacyl-[acyl-carrier-protein] synthase II
MVQPYGGQIGIGPITRFDTTGFATRIAAEVKTSPGESFQEGTSQNGPFLAWPWSFPTGFDDSKLKIPPIGPMRGVFMGCGLGGLTTIEDYHKISWIWPEVCPFFIPMLIGNMAPGCFHLPRSRGPNLAVCNGVRSGNACGGQAFHMVRDGMADIMITGGVESVVTPLCVAGFYAMRAFPREMMPLKKLPVLRTGPGRLCSRRRGGVVISRK